MTRTSALIIASLCLTLVAELILLWQLGEIHKLNHWPLPWPLA
jgi:hypothetical protein